MTTTSGRAGLGAALLLLVSACGVSPDGTAEDGCSGCGRGPANLAIAAVDHNDGLHLAAVGLDGENHAPYLNVYRRGAGGRYETPVSYAMTAKDVAIIAADLNGDGLPDLVGFNSLDGGGKIPVWLSDVARPGMFVAGPSLNAGRVVNMLAVGDLNGDGRKDIAVSAGARIEVFLQNVAPAGTFSGPTIVSSASTGGAVAIGDLNGDHVADIAMNTAQGVTLLLQNGSAPGSYRAVPLGTGATAGSRFIYIADLDGDGLNDLIVSGPPSASGTVSTLVALLQDKHDPGHFRAPVSYSIAGAGDAANVVAVSLSGHGSAPPDLVVGGVDGVAVLVHDPQHAGAFLPAVYYTQADGAGLAVADVNGDGLPDIIVPGNNPPAPQVLMQDATHPGSFLDPSDI
jgi:hypothetical protein